MATLVVSPRNSLRSVRSSSSTRSLDEAKARKIANRHLPYCPPGSAPRSRSRTPVTPPASPPIAKPAEDAVLSLLHPAEAYNRIHSEPNIYALDAAQLYKAVTHISSNALPDPATVFPWLHGLHPDNEMQLAFFLARRRAMRNAPQCMRGITILKAGGNMSQSKLKGSVSPEEVLAPQTQEHQTFFDMDPREGFSVRSFNIQVSKMALISDIVVYKDDDTPAKDLQDLALRCAAAQFWYREKCKKDGYEDLPMFNTFVVMSSFSNIEAHYPDLVSIDAKGEASGKVLDFFAQEKLEMSCMSRQSAIANNVWLGPSPDACDGRKAIFTDGDTQCFDVLLEASDSATMPSATLLREAARKCIQEPQKIAVPSSGNLMPPSWNHEEVDGLLALLSWMYKGANPPLLDEDDSDTGDEEATSVDGADDDGDVRMDTLGQHQRGCRFLIHCTDGYTETSLLGLAYLMYSECLTAPEAWLRMHRELGRNFFAYTCDVSLLSSIQPRILQESPKRSGSGIPSNPPAPPQWFKRIDGSLPSRITPYMYLGNLVHANNPELLELLGVRRVLSVGEPISWAQKRKEQWGRDNLMFVDGVQDNGIDSLTSELDRCLAFIEDGKKQGYSTLVHCRVGVSRSATICIAEIMSSMNLSLPRAYCFVRARRLNVIIQPHLRFTYELLKWEEEMQLRHGQSIRREMEWAGICREIAAMNRPYTNS